MVVTAITSLTLAFFFALLLYNQTEKMSAAEHAAVALMIFLSCMAAFYSLLFLSIGSESMERLVERSREQMEARLEELGEDR